MSDVQATRAITFALHVDLLPSRGRAVERSDERFSGLYREQYGRVRAYALRRAPPEVAHDFAADTFNAWRRLDRALDRPE